ncbi:unnamed protein product [Schistosoma curassoni]|uniref:Conserved oligomeric Golgi complex subunit 5 N-terminal domain-containing protein n=1 Tax=Schistosoma curassoni TaxID=6186 RepID=A0A3P8FAY2_9TREM|nr:unnamed protein product [Schistosoma curassoni]
MNCFRRYVVYFSIIHRLATLIHQHVADNHVDLFKRASDIDNLQNVLQAVEDKIRNLSISLSKVKKKIDTPHETLSTNVTHFKNLHITCAILRNISRVATLMKRIQSRSKDLCQCAMYVNELKFIFNNMEWEGIHVLESYNRALVQVRESMVSQAWSLINSSYELSDQTQLATGLQQLVGKYSKSEIPVKDKEGKRITEIQRQRNRWVEHFEEPSNRPTPLNPPNIEVAPADLPIAVTPSAIAKIRIAIKLIKSGKAAGTDDIPTEALKSDRSNCNHAPRSIQEDL